MSEPPGNRQEDLDWLYGREPDARPNAAGPRESDAGRPRVSTPTYAADQPEPGELQGPSQASRPPQQPQRPPQSQGPPGARPTAESLPTQIRRRRRTPRWRRWLRVTLLALVAWLIFLVATPIYALGRMAEVDQSGSAERPPRQPGTATLLVGTDARTPGSGYEPVPGDEDLTSERADTIMLLYQPPTGRSVLVSLPRDSYVPIPGFGQDKLNAAYAYGGPALLTETVELVTGIRLDGYLEIGFDGFANLVDAVGGVEVCTDIPLQDDFSGLDLPAGCSELGGPQALAYVRMRYADPRGDIGRAERQREDIGKVVGQAASPISVLNPFRYWNLNMAAARMLTRGDETGVFDLLGAARALIGVAGGDGLSLVVPIADPAGVSEDGASVVIWDRENALAMFDEISRGDTSQLDRFLG